MKFLSNLTLIALAILFLNGCEAKRNVRVAPLFADDPYWASVTQKPVTQVLVTEGDLMRKYRPIARLFIDSAGYDKSISFERMKEEGAKIGADAVINIKVTSQYEGQEGRSPVTRHFLEGMAVIYGE